jgi:hypothetical protein
MRDFDGNELVVGDLVYWRHDKKEAFMESGRILRIWEQLGLAMLYPNTKFHDGVQKASRNIKKMTDEEAMLWQLENA